MQHPFVSLWEKPSRLVVGLMSGTSADGVDAALTRITGSGLDSRVEQLGFYFQPFDDATRQEILAVCGGDFGGSREICLLGTHLGKLYAQAVRELLKKTGTERIDLIGCHGQTVWHIPEQTPYLGGTVRGTLQIGDPSYLAEEFGCPVVFAKKKKPSTMENMLVTKVFSFTKNNTYDVCVCKDYLQPGDKVLFIDDFLANGNAAKGVMDLVRQSGAELAGMGFLIEKAFQHGGDYLRAQGIHVESLAVIESLEGCRITLKE